MREDASGAGKIGTTRRGIGPAYEDKVGRRAIRICDLAHLDDLEPQSSASAPITTRCARVRPAAGRSRPPDGGPAGNRAVRAALCQAGLGDA
jgi:hypothetical protein